MDRLKAMEIFVRVVEAGGLAKAARTLSIPPSSVTMTLQQLERYLGVRLVQRSTRQISLTAEGAAYYQRCLNILAEVADTEASLRQEPDNPRGRVRVDLPGAIATSLLLPEIGKFRARYPDIDLAIGLNDRRVDLIQEGVDIAIRIGALGDLRLCQDDAAGEVLVLVASWRTKADWPAHIDSPRQRELAAQSESEDRKALMESVAVTRLHELA